MSYNDIEIKYWKIINILSNDNNRLLSKKDSTVPYIFFISLKKDTVLEVYLIEPYFGGSHKFFIKQLCDAFSDLADSLKIISLPPRHWKFRLQLSHVTLAELVNKELAYRDPQPNKVLFICNSLMDIAAFRAMLARPYKNSLLWCYFHENQMSYPLQQESPSFNQEKINQQHIFPAFHLNQILTADKVFFNSYFNKEDTFQKLNTFISTRPEKVMKTSLSKIFKEAEVIPVGLEPCPLKTIPMWKDRPKRILWNHRWEYDKNPEEFFRLVSPILERNSTYELSLIGENNRDDEGYFREFKNQYSGQITAFGYIEQRNSYWQELVQCRVLPVTSNHDFLGLSILEATSVGVIPMLPKRMVYPELIPDTLKSKLLYEKDPYNKLEFLIQEGISEEELNILRNHLAFYSTREVKKKWKLNFPHN